jgi:uncharacterized protein
MKKAVASGLRMAAAIYVGFMLVLAGCQRSMMYYPTRAAEEDLLRMAALEGLEPWRDDEGGIVGWRLAGGGRGGDAMLVFHGNAGMAANRGYLAEGFAPHFDVYLMEYPGYGARSGSPSEAHFAEAARAALEQLRRELSGRIFLGGESIGTGVASRLAGEHPDAVDGLFLATPFTSLTDVAKSHYPMFPVGLFLRDRYESEKHLRGFRKPVAFLVAGRDEVVPSRLGLALYEGYGGAKRLWVQDGRSHNTVDYSARAVWWGEVAELLKTGGGTRGETL